MKNFLADIFYWEEWHNKLLYYTANSLLLLMLIIKLTACADFDKPLMPMERIPGGTFMMGNPNTVWSADETPQHKVILSGFYMGKYEVTLEQYRAVMDAAHVNNFAGTEGREDTQKSYMWLVRCTTNT